MDDLSIVSLIVGLIVGFIVLIIGLFKYFDGKFDKKIDEIKNEMKENHATMSSHRCKFQNETITKEETQKLKEILEEEQKEAEKVGNGLALIAIGLMLIVGGYFLYKLMESENK